MTMTFSLLALAICSVWLAPIRVGRQLSISPWTGLFTGAVVAGCIAGFLRWPALVWLVVFTAAAFAFASATSRRQRLLFGATTALLALALALHWIPGFSNPLLVGNMRFSSDAAPFSQYANFDKASAGLILLALLARRSTHACDWRMTLRRTLPIAIATTTVVMGAAITAGLVRPDLKLPAYTLIFLATNLLFVCVAEEAFFRGFVQEQLSRALSRTSLGEPLAVISSAALFGAAHLGGGLTYAGITALAGLGYATAYSATKRIEAPILVHFGLNAVHFIGFTYPRLS